jgi:hypothetical protein
VIRDDPLFEPTAVVAVLEDVRAADLLRCQLHPSVARRGKRIGLIHADVIGIMPVGFP